MASPEIEAIVPTELTLDRYQELAARTAGREPIVMSVMRKLVDKQKVYALFNPGVARITEGIADDVMEETFRQLAPHWSMMVAALGLAGEAGEFADLIKKELGHGHPVNYDKREKELGDTLWYVADAARLSGFGLGSLAKTNTVKLDDRYGAGGFSTEKSIKRVDENPSGLHLVGEIKTGSTTKLVDIPSTKTE
jgi:NTP pyrophosphatase (non-canonical NTP hydrolase)